MIADPMWFKTVQFDPNECVSPSYIGRVLTTITCVVGVLAPEDLETFVEASTFSIHKAGKLLLKMPVKTLISAGPGGVKLPVPIKLTVTTRVSIETAREAGARIKAPIIVSLGGDFQE